MSSALSRTTALRYVLCLALLGLLFFIPRPAAANYEELPHRFADLVADEDKASDSIAGYFINNGAYGKNYSGFKFFIPPGTINVKFQFSATDVNHYGPHIFSATRFNAQPQASLQDFISREAELACLITGPFAKINDLVSPQGFMAKRTSSGERAFLLDDVNAEEVLPGQFKDSGGWVYVNFYNKSNGSGRVSINVIRGSFRVIPEKYNAWRETMNFPSPEPAEPPEPEFGFSIPARTNAELSQVYTANVNFSNFKEPKSISISGADGRYRIGDGEYTNAQGTVEPGQSVTVRLTSSSGYSSTVSTTLNMGGKTGQFRVTTKPDPDGPGQAISFNPNHVAGVSKNTWVESSVIDVVVNDTIRISSPGEYKVNSGSYTSRDGTVKPGDRVQVRLRSSDKDYTTVSTSLWIGSASGVFRVTTAPGSDGGGGGNSPFPPICDMFPDLSQCGGSPTPPETEPEKEVRISSQLTGFDIKDVATQQRQGPESLELILELPSGWPGNNGNNYEYGYMFGLLEIPDSGLFLAQMDIFGQVLLFPYLEGDPLVPFGIELLNGQGVIKTSPFATLQRWQMTAGGLADLGAVFYIAIVPDGDWDNYVGGSFRFSGGSGTNSVNSLDALDVAGADVYSSGSQHDQFSGNGPLALEASFKDFYHTTFEAQEHSAHQPLVLDLRLPHGWEEMLGQHFEGKDASDIVWAVFALIVCDETQDQFLVRADIHYDPRLVFFDSYTPVRPAVWTEALSSGSVIINLSPCIDNLGLTPRHFAELGLHFYVALVPDWDWDNYFGLHFNFEEFEE